eukprot:11246841-Alexandrium_andersonii.AAC.1
MRNSSAAIGPRRRTRRSCQRQLRSCVPGTRPRWAEFPPGRSGWCHTVANPVSVTAWPLPGPADGTPAQFPRPASPYGAWGGTGNATGSALRPARP